MATAAAQPKHNDHQNWIKVAVALHITKEGLEDFVLDDITQFQNDLLSSICRNIGIPVGTTCNSCTTANILSCPTVGFCALSGRCKMHDLKDPARKPDVPCQSNICQAIRGGIRREHRFFYPNKFEPSWKNADATRFCIDPFQLAKCYMSADGYSNVKSLKETDFNGVINVVINNKRFQNKIAAKLSQKSNIFNEARDIGRLIRHSASLSISDADLTKYIDTLIGLLSDAKYLILDKKAKIAVAKLQQLKTKGISSNEEDSKRILDAVLKLIESVSEKAKDITDYAVKEIKDSILLLRKANNDGIQANTRTSLKKISDTSKVALKNIELKRRKVLKDIEVAAGNVKTTVDKERGLVAKRSSDKYRSLIIYVPEPVEEINISPTKSKETDIEKTMLTESLREDLIIHYRTNCSTVPLSPLMEERDVPLAKLDVPQKLVSVDLIKTFYQFKDSPSQTPVKSYKGLFFCGSEHYRNIYITAKAGVGKTLLSKKLCLIWCQAYTPESSAIFKSEDMDAIRTFDFLFFLTLGEADSSDCDIDDMIQTQVITKLSRHRHYTKEFLTDILHSKVCLIILDGLDEWSHSNISAPGCRAELIPKRKARSKCTILTTTRPWKLNALRLKDSQIDKHVRICELDEDTSAKLIENAVSLLNGRSKPPKSAKKIQEAVAKSKLDEMRFIPYIILQFVCLLFDGKPISRSKCELYSNIVELILSRGRAKLRHTHSYALKSKQQLPRCFTNNEECKENYGLLLSIGRLAFEELFSEDEEYSSIFEKTTVLKYMSSETLDICLNLGLLTQSKTNETVAFRHVHFAFQHKSMQEYFAALYAQSKHDPKTLEKVKQKILNKCQSLPSDLNLSAVFVFICGFQQEFARDLLQKVLDVMSETEIISKFRTTSSIVRSSIVNSKIVKHFQRLVADCWKESLNSGHMEMRLLVQDIVIDKNTSQDDYLDALKSFVELGKNNLKSMCVQECVSANEANNVLQKLKTQNICYLRKLELRSIPAVHILQPLLKRNKTSLRCLDLCSFKFGKSEYRYYSEELNLPSEHLRTISEMEYLQVLTLASFCMNHNDMDLLLRFLTRKTSMRQIVLYRIGCTKNNTCNGHALDLSLHENLQVFGLDNIPLSQFILNPATLEECWIGQLPSHILSKIFADLQNSRNLLTLYCLKHDDICAMLQSLPSLCQVKHLSFRHIDFGRRVIRLAANTKNIQIVTLNAVKMTSTTLRLLFDTIERFPHKVDICLENCHVTPVYDYELIKDIIRKSDSYTVSFDGLNVRKERVFNCATIETCAMRTGTTLITASTRL